MHTILAITTNSKSIKPMVRIVHLNLCGGNRESGDEDRAGRGHYLPYDWDEFASGNGYDGAPPLMYRSKQLQTPMNDGILATHAHTRRDLRSEPASTLN